MANFEKKTIKSTQRVLIFLIRWIFHLYKKQPKLLPEVTFSGLSIRKMCLLAYSAPLDLLARFKGAASRQLREGRKEKGK